jgi:IS4 transposase
MLQAVAGVEVARSAVTQRFGAGSAKLMEQVFLLAVKRLPQANCPEMLSKLDEFQAVLAHDGSVVTLSPLLKKLFPATRTNSVKAAGKVHATADLMQRRIVQVKVTGERDSELAVARAQPLQPQALYISDLGYTSYDYFAEIVAGNADFLSRLKDNANPTIVAVRHGIRAPAATVRRELGLNSPELQFTQSHGSFDVDARFKTKKGSVILRVVGLRNPDTGKYHRYVTSLSHEDFIPKELETLYSLRWWIELLFKVLKSSCHLDHLDTSKPDAIRTYIYASLFAATILSGICHAAASTYGIPLRAISPLTVGVAAPTIVIPLLLLWLQRPLTPEELADCILRVVAIGCRDQNPSRTRDQWAPLRHH